MTYSNGHKPYGYDKNVDYSEKMNAAAAAGDYAAAARYEQQRNEKIAGEGLTQYQPTQQYAQYLPKTNAEQMDELFEQIMNRDKFSYDLNGDALYQQYKDRYLEQGRLAMQDTMGQAAALTGGYGNSYAQTVGQQAYAQQLDRLNDLVPDLYTLALSNYEREGENLWQQYEAYAAREQQEYDRWLEEQNQIREEEKENKDDAFSLAMTMLQNGLMPSESVLSTAGLSTEDAKAIYDKANTPVYHGGGSNPDDSDDKQLTDEMIEILYNFYSSGDTEAFKNEINKRAWQGYDMTYYFNLLYEMENNGFTGGYTGGNSILSAGNTTPKPINIIGTH